MSFSLRRDSAPRSPSAATPRVLVADDEKNIRLALAETLRASATVDEAVDGQEAIDKMAGTTYDLVLCDLKMPRADGMAVLRAAADVCPDVPVVMITAHGDVETAVEAMQAGAAGFVQKPFSPDQIRAVAARHLDREASSRQAAESYDAHLRHAQEAVEGRRLEAALEHARQALALRPDRPDPFNVLGVVAQLQMDVAEAQRYFRSALALDDGFGPARKNLENLSGFPKRLGQFRLS